MKTCKRGHSSGRYPKGGACIKCTRTRTKARDSLVALEQAQWERKSLLGELFLAQDKHDRDQIVASLEQEIQELDIKILRYERDIEAWNEIKDLDLVSKYDD